MSRSLGKKDVLIIGRGLAGAWLAFSCLSKNLSFDLVGSGPAASDVAAGLFTPLSGKRWARTPLDTVLLPCAATSYAVLEKQYGKKIRYQMPHIRLIDNLAEAKNLQERMANDSIQKGYIEALLPSPKIESYRAPFGGALMTESGFIDVQQLRESVTEAVLARGWVQERRLEQADLTVAPDHAVMGGTRYRHVIFCEGAEISRNPWFQGIPFRHAKGESLLVTAGLPEDYILTTSNGLYVLPLGGRQFRLGATYDWDRLDFVPTEAGRDELLTRLAAVHDGPVTVLEHQAGVRPVGRNRVPLCSMAVNSTVVGALNCFGSKGVIYAPYYSDLLASHLATGSALPDDVSARLHSAPKGKSRWA